MQEIRVERFGPPSVVGKCVNVPNLEVPSAWEAIVKVDAFPINPADLAMLSGAYGILPNLPSTIGMEAAGRIESIGESVTDFQVGDSVLIVANNNWAQYRRVPVNLLHKVPVDFDPVVVATMKVNPATAYMLLTRFLDLKRGDWVIQNAPLSNVGRLVIQFAQQLGLKTINLVRRPEAVEQVREIGGDVAVNFDDGFREEIRHQLGRAKVKLAFDAVGGESTNAIASVCSQKAKIITYGMLSGEACQLSPERIVFDGMEHHGFWLSRLLNRMSHSERVSLYDHVIQLFQDRMAEPNIDACFTIDQLNEALRYAEQGLGKAIVFPNGTPTNSPLAQRLLARKDVHS